MEKTADHLCMCSGAIKSMDFTKWAQVLFWFQPAEVKVSTVVLKWNLIHQEQFSQLACMCRTSLCSSLCSLGHMICLDKSPQQIWEAWMQVCWGLMDGYSVPSLGRRENVSQPVKIFLPDLKDKEIFLLNRIYVNYRIHQDHISVLVVSFQFLPLKNTKWNAEEKGELTLKLSSIKKSQNHSIDFF